jgi:hypothetical protein
LKNIIKSPQIIVGDYTYYDDPADIYNFEKKHIISLQYDYFKDCLKEWKVSSGYHRRSLIEAFIFRLKRIFAFNLQHKTERRRNEITTKLNISNVMASFGKAENCS